MQKRGTLLLTLLASINFASAISIGDFLDQIGGENILLGGTFLIAFALLNMILGRLSLFKDAYGQTKKTSVIISLIVSLFIIYGIRTLNFDLENFFFNLGLSGDILYQIASIIVLIGLIYVIYKFGKKIWSYLCWIFILSGIGLIWLGLSDLVFNGEPLLIAGLVLFILGIICWWRRRKKAPTFDKVAPEFMQKLVTNGDRQQQRNLEGLYNQYKQELENLRKMGATNNPEIAKTNQKIQKDLQEAQAEAAKSAETQRFAEAARKKAEEEIKLANEENEFLKKSYADLARINDPIERDRKEKELIAARQKAEANAQKAKQDAATAERARQAAAAEEQKAQRAMEQAKADLKYSIKLAEEEAYKLNEAREKRKTAKTKEKPDSIKLTFPKKIAANSTQTAKLGWTGGASPFQVIWYINHGPVSQSNSLKRNWDKVEIKIPNLKGGRILLTAKIKGSNGMENTINQIVEII